MKRVLSVILILALALPMTFTANAAATAEIRVCDGSYIASDKYGIEDIKTAAADFGGTSAELEKLAKKFGDHLQKTDVYVNDIESINDIYGIQGNLSFGSEYAVPLGFVTTIENGKKAGASLWDAYLKLNETDNSRAQLLLYGLMPLTSAANKAVNAVDDDSYRIGTLYYLVAKEQTGDIDITFSATDIATKDRSGTVVSAAKSFAKETTATVKRAEQSTALSLSMLGAKIRTAGAQGLRFGASVKKDDFYAACSDVEYGVLIAVTNSLGGKQLSLDCGKKLFNCPATVLEDNDDSLVFSGEVTDFPLDGSYDTVNFTARAYACYQDPQSGKDVVVYADQIVRSVDIVCARIQK